MGDTKGSLNDKLNEECQSMRNDFTTDRNNLCKELEKLAVEIKGNSDDIRNELEQEKNERKQDKLDTYSDFEQICRNIDDRVTGEKEKLWDKLKSDEERFENYKVQCEDENDQIKRKIDEE